MAVKIEANELKPLVVALIWILKWLMGEHT